MSFRARMSCVVVAAVAVSSLGLGPAAAISITNRDDKEYKVTIIEEDGAKKTDHALKPNQVLENVCLKGCVLRLDDSDEDEYELVEGTEIVSIEEGYLYYDQPEAATPPAQSPEKKQ